MEKLEHLTPYLPYGLKVVHIFREKKEYHKLIGIEYNNAIIVSVGSYLQNKNTYGKRINVDIGRIKPILRPLSDLTKEEYFSVWKFEMDEESLIFHFLDLDFESRFLDKYSLSFWNDLLSKHFDIFGLIEKGLAIDINTLTNEELTLKD